MTSPLKLSNREARRLAISSQGLASDLPRGGPTAGKARLRRLMTQLGTIQLDAVNVLARTQFLVPFSRLGGFDQAQFRKLSEPGGGWFEYWGHAASLLPLELYPLLRWRMERFRDDLIDSPTYRERRREWRRVHRDYLASVLAEVADQGPLAASQLAEPRRRPGEWWDRRSEGRQALEFLFADGVLAAWRSPNFERVYDLRERVIPTSVLDLPTPSLEEAQRELIAIAASCLGVATVGDLADYFLLRPAAALPRVSELLEQKRLLQVEVEGWSKPAFVAAEPHPRAPGNHGRLISPFDSLIWTRERTQRLFGFRYRIEIYVPAPLRTHGYYVMPLLLGDQLVARLDLKADRQASRLLVQAAFIEPDQDPQLVAAAAARELHRLREWLGLQELRVSGLGDLAPRLSALTRR